MSTLSTRRLALYAAAPLTVLVLSAAPAAAQPYPPDLPGATETSAPVDEGVLGSGTGTEVTGPNGGTAVLGTKIGGSQLALTGSDVLPYLAGGLVLVAGGAVVLVSTRRRSLTTDGG